MEGEVEAVGQPGTARRRRRWEEACRAREDHITHRGRRNDSSARVTTISPSSRKNNARRSTRP